MRDLDWSDVVADGMRAAEANGYDHDTRGSEGQQVGYEVESHVVPRTTVSVSIYRTGNLWTVIREPGNRGDFVVRTEVMRESEESARNVANQLWVRSIQLRDKEELNTVCRVFKRP